jgi:pyrroloquinoline quinone (PQQ) biosynthesis protein C
VHLGSSNREALDQLIAGERVWLDITVLRFLGHPALLRVFPEYMIGVYHAMRTAGALMTAARLRSTEIAPECPVADRLVDYWTRHIVDEAGHDRWLLEDLPALGIDCEHDLTNPPIPEVAELLGTLHFWVLHTHPVAALAYFYVLERSPPTAQLLDWMVESAGVPRDALRTLYRHSIIDVEHGRELEELLDSLPLTEAHQQLLAVSATTVVRQVARIMERHVQRADELLASEERVKTQVQPTTMTGVSI